ncbi:MAG TPA: nicotinate-nucleotide adenylyltransferase [Pyrinomonadaceae bacterium]|nr:nicotinate-nucleotide adenylyltransferase [Pyrinomonadaceae bacterium]
MNIEDIAPTQRKRIAFFGGSFDPVHNGHYSIARALLEQFSLAQFVFIPAFHAPHKVRLKPTSAYDRYAMLCLATADEREMSVSRIEIESPERPFSVETMPRLIEMFPNADLFFVIGGDSWEEITTWREWERVLSLMNIIVVTRPGTELLTDHVTEEIRSRIIDVRGKYYMDDKVVTPTIYFSDAVELDVSATAIRKEIRDGGHDWRSDVPERVANYIEKYQIYK